MKNLLMIPLLLLLAGCNKNAVEKFTFRGNTDTGPYTQYRILKGAHKCSEGGVKPVSGIRFNFKVKFDSTAIYKTLNAANQGNINQLYGFTEDAGSLLNSASFGWNWNNNALHLYAHTYTDGIESFEEITTVAIGQAITCGIGIYEDQYFFSIEGKSIVLPRAIHSAGMNGYWQYPGFGVNETAPHLISIYILDLEN